MNSDVILVEVSVTDLLTLREDEIVRNTPQILLDLKQYFDGSHPTIKYNQNGYALDVYGHKFTAYNDGGYSVAKAGGLTKTFRPEEIIAALFYFQDIVGVKVA